MHCLIIIPFIILLSSCISQSWGSECVASMVVDVWIYLIVRCFFYWILFVFWSTLDNSLTNSQSHCSDTESTKNHTIFWQSFKVTSCQTHNPTIHYLLVGAASIPLYFIALSAMDINLPCMTVNGSRNLHQSVSIPLVGMLESLPSYITMIPNIIDLIQPPCLILDKSTNMTNLMNKSMLYCPNIINAISQKAI